MLRGEMLSLFATLSVAISSGAEARAVTVGHADADFIGDTDVAIQRAIDEVAARGGGEVVVRAGEYLCRDSVRLASHVTLRGEGDVVLSKDAGLSAPLTSDCGFGYDRVRVADPSAWRVGYGVALKDDLNAGGFNVSVRTIAAIEGDDLVLDEDGSQDYCVHRSARVEHSFPVVAGYGVTGARVIGLTCEGSKGENGLLDGCRGGAIYLYRSPGCQILDCTAQGFHGDGISFQISPNTIVRGCVSRDNTHLGLHPGSGSHHSTIASCESYGNGDVGLFLCWRVAFSHFEGNRIHDNGGPGISIGHKDTDNLFVHNTVEGNGGPGVLFRDEPDYNAGHRCTLRENVLRNNGAPGAAAIELLGATTGTRIERNRVADDRGEGAPACALHVGASASDLIFAGNSLSGFAETARCESTADDVRIE